MSQAEKTNVKAGEQITPQSARLLTAEIDVPPKIRDAIEKHRSDLAELMKDHKYQWAAYWGDVRLEIGKSKRSLYRKYLQRGISLDELVVLGIGPQIPDEIDSEDLNDISANRRP